MGVHNEFLPCVTRRASPKDRLAKNCRTLPRSIRDNCERVVQCHQALPAHAWIHLKHYRHGVLCNNHTTLSGDGCVLGPTSTARAAHRAPNTAGSFSMLTRAAGHTHSLARFHYTGALHRGCKCWHDILTTNCAICPHGYVSCVRGLQRFKLR